MFGVGVYKTCHVNAHTHNPIEMGWYASSFTTVLSVPTERVVAAVLGNELTGGPHPMIESITYPTHPNMWSYPRTSSAEQGTGNALVGSSDSSLDLDQDGTGSDPL